MFRESDVKKLLNSVITGNITFSKFIEILNEKKYSNLTEAQDIEDIIMILQKFLNKTVENRLYSKIQTFISELKKIKNENPHNTK